MNRFSTERHASSGKFSKQWDNFSQPNESCVNVIRKSRSEFPTTVSCVKNCLFILIYYSRRLDFCGSHYDRTAGVTNLESASKKTPNFSCDLPPTIRAVMCTLFFLDHRKQIICWICSPVTGFLLL